MSRPIASAGMASAATVATSVSAENSFPQTMSTGRTISTPDSCARGR